MAPEITIRQAQDTDRPGLDRLAALDTAVALAGTVLVAEERGEMRAAIELETGRVVANPFAPTASLVELLRRRRENVSALAA